MRLLLFASFALAFIAACSSSGKPSAASNDADATPPPTPPSDAGSTDDAGGAHDAEHAAITAYLEAEIAKYDIPGAQIAIVEDGKLAFAKSVGVKKHGGTDPVTDNTRFRVASLSKMVLGATALSLVDDGKLDLKKTLDAVIPEYQLKAPFDPATITVENLLTHTAGIPDVNVTYMTCPGVTTLASYFATKDGVQPLWSPPGQLWNYSNRGFTVAGWVLETLGGDSYEQLATTRVLEKAGMTRATFDLAATMADDHAVGWAPDRTTGALTSFEPDSFDCIGAHPPAGISATAIDYAHFAETLFAGGGTMLTAASLTAFETGHAKTDEYPGEMYAYGLNVHDGYKGLHILRHDGELVDGYLTAIWMVPDQKFAVVVFFNAMSRSPDEPARYAVDQILGLTKVASPDYSTPSSTWTKYAGTYVDPTYFGTINVSLDGSTLKVDVPSLSLSGIAMTQYAGDVFTFPLNAKTTQSMTFFPDASGAIKWFVTRSGVGTLQ